MLNKTIRHIWKKSIYKLKTRSQIYYDLHTPQLVLDSKNVDALPGLESKS